MEHVQPLDRPFPWRLATLVACAVVLAIRAGLVLTHRAKQTGPVAATGRVQKSQAATFAVPLRPRSAVAVLVLNGNGTSGAAGATATRLLARGYRSATATNAASDAYATSLVLYRRGWQREAQRLAKDAGSKVVAPLDGRLPAGSARVPLVLILGAN